jgi:hypothetical protein
MIETNQRIIVISNEGGEGKEGVGGIKPTIKRHLKLPKKRFKLLLEMLISWNIL